MSWNLIDDPIKDIAYYIRRNAITTGSVIRVWVRDSGAVVTRKADSRLTSEISDSWLVGSYDRKARAEDIAVDLHERLREIRANLSVMDLMEAVRCKA